MTRDDPFGVLGLEPSRELTDDDVRTAWRRVAAATHPDRTDGGEPAAFAAAAAAYTVLRTAAGRGEAVADLLAPGDIARTLPRSGGRAARAGQRVLTWPARLRNGRPLVLAVRILAAAGTCAIAVAAAGWQPATIAIATGLATWLLLTGRGDVAPPA